MEKKKVAIPFRSGLPSNLIDLNRSIRLRVAIPFRSGLPSNLIDCIMEVKNGVAIPFRSGLPSNPEYYYNLKASLVAIPFRSGLPSNEGRASPRSCKSQSQSPSDRVCLPTAPHKNLFWIQGVTGRVEWIWKTFAGSPPYYVNFCHRSNLDCQRSRICRKYSPSFHTCQSGSPPLHGPLPSTPSRKRWAPSGMRAPLPRATTSGLEGRG